MSAPAADFNSYSVASDHILSAAMQIADIHDISVYDIDTFIQLILIVNVLDTSLKNYILASSI